MKFETLLDRLGVTAEATLTDTTPPWGDPREVRSWSVTLRKSDNEVEVTVDFFTGPAIEREPSAADVISCLLMDRMSSSEGFEEFCANSGLDTDSRKARATWRKVRVNSRKVERLLGNDLDGVECAAIDY